MNLRLLSFVSAALTVLLASCASMLGPREVEIPLSKLQQAVDDKFPFNSRYLDLLDVHVGQPRLELLPAEDRLLTRMRVEFAPSYLNRTWSGNFAVSGRIVYDPRRDALLLADPRVEKLALDGFDMPYADQLTKIAGFLAEQLLQDLPLHRFRPDELRFGGMRFLPSKIKTNPSGLVVTLVPAR